MKEADVVIVGAGPGGIAAAIEATKAGATVALFDENPKPGGQIYRQYQDGFQVTDSHGLGHDYMRGQELLAEFNTVLNQIQYVDSALVWGVFDENELAFVRGETCESMRCKTLIISVGAFDRPVPFPGWTLPGVLTAGGAQVLVKNQRVLPGDRILLAGTGPLQLALANQIADAGGNVIAVLEAGRVKNWFGLAIGALGQWQLLGDAVQYGWGVCKAGIPLRRHHIIVEARGDGRVEEAVVAEVDENWRPKPNTRRILSVDTICLGYGFVPSVELTRLAGCQHRYEPLLGGWIPVRGEDMQTSVASIYAVGDCTGIAGSFVALEEGRIAGLSAVRSLGYISAEEAMRRAKSSRKRLLGLQRLRKALDQFSAPRPGLYELAQDDTIVCRCEEITLKEIKQALAEGATEMSEVKRMTRLGMGLCQGRMCGPALQETIARLKGLPPGSLGYLNPRPPVKPISLNTLASPWPLME